MYLGCLYPALYCPDWPDDIPVGADGLTQLAVEAFLARAAEAQLSQVAIEVLYPRISPAHLTQLALELFYPVGVKTHATQFAIELRDHRVAHAALTQVLVELFIRFGTCPDSGFPIDPVVPGGACADTLPLDPDE